MSSEEFLFPLSFGQQRLWFLDQVAPGSPVYNIPLAVTIETRLDGALLERSLNEVVRRHEVLRTRFKALEGQPRQVVMAELRVPLEQTDLRGLPAAEQEEAVLREANQEAQRSFDLRTGPLLRARLLRLEQRHVLLLTLHHIVCDAWSLNVLWKELSSIYTRLAEGRGVELPELPLQYADYAVWQREQLQGERIEEQLGYWERRLAELPVLELPRDRARPAVASFRGGQRAMRVPAGLTERLRRLGQQSGATLYMTVLAGFAALLARYTGQEEVVIGAPVAGRNRAELEGLIGFFVNTLVLRLKTPGGESFRKLVESVREVTLEGWAHQEVPFEMVVEKVQPERDLSRNPLFQVTFQLLPGGGGGAGRGLEVRRETAIFDLSLSLWESGEGLWGGFEYSTELFEAERIERMERHLLRLLEAAVEDPEGRIEELELLDESERQEVLEEWNATEREYSREVCLHELVARQAAERGEATALVCGQERLSYREMEARSNQFGHYLQRQGVGPERMVGIALERSVEMVVALLGILKAGGAYVPLDPNYPKERLKGMLEDAGVEVVVTSLELRERLPLEGRRCLCLEQEREAIARESPQAPASGVTAANLAYVIFTSGSTGRPKGVAIAHSAIVNHMLWMNETFPLASDDRILQRTAISFDASVWELFAPLIAGVQLIILEPQRLQSGPDLIDTIVTHGVTTIQLVPSILRMLLEEQAAQRCASLRRVFCGGEVLSAHLADTFSSTLRAQLWNLYGPTEASVDATFGRGEAESGGGTAPIGRPIANMRAYILDRCGKPTPMGVQGELHLAGAGLARGYVNRPELTAERFLPDPFSREPGSRVYCTGDVARLRYDGQIEYLGRADHEVKLRGIRIDLREIEAVLEQHEQVREAVVLVRGDRLVAYFKARTDGTETADLRRYLRQKLPEQMIPLMLLPVAAMPLGPNGKLDRRRLPEPVSEAEAAPARYEAPRTPLERVLASLWAEILDTRQIGVEDNFFEAGGQSLKAIQTLARVRDAFQVELSLRRFFEAPTVAGMAAALLEDDAARARIEGTAELMAAVEEMSEEEVESLLAEAGGRRTAVG